jgi:hypothetical protein
VTPGTSGAGWGWSLVYWSMASVNCSSPHRHVPSRTFLDC